jgi:uncharacterized membrane protein YcaP (DUF421 family)
VRKQPWDGRKYLQIIYDKELISKTYKELLQRNKNNRESLEQKKSKRFEQTFLQRRKWLISK